MAGPLRIWPGMSMFPYGQRPGTQTFDIIENRITTVTALVHILGLPNIYALTAGHSFRDVDGNKSIQIAPQNTNIIGIAALAGMSRPIGQPAIAWDEHDKRQQRSTDAPLGMSFGQYHCGGDKLGSLYDAGLVMLRGNPNPPPGMYNNHFRNYQGLTIQITAYEVNWPPQPLAAGEIYFAGIAQRHPIPMNPFRPNFASDLENWQGGAHSPLDNIILFRDTGTTTFGFSGMPLLRYNPANPTQATLVGIFLGVARDTAAGPNGNHYEIFQHFSQAVAGLNIVGLA